MKKITILAALLGTVYFANAQVGIGTPDPSLSAELEILSKTKGVLIPRVDLTSITQYAPIQGNPTQSLLVYNLTVTPVNPGAEPSEADLVEGFYYWEDSKWNRIINRSDLDQALANLGDINAIINDVEEIQNVINYILPSNPGNQTPPEDRPSHTTIIYNQDTNIFEEVTYDTITNSYTTKVISGLETITVLLPVVDADGKRTGFKYYNEADVRAFLAADPNNTIADIDVNTPGGVLIDVIGDVVNNFEEITNSQTTIDKGDGTFYTVEEYIQYISQANGNVIYTLDTTSNTWSFQYWDETTEEYVNIDLSQLVENLETITVLLPVVDADGKRTGFKYYNEADVRAFLAADPNNTIADIDVNTPGGVLIDVIGDVVNNFEEITNSQTTIDKGDGTFFTVEEYIEYISQADGSVIYTLDTTSNTWSFQYWDETTEEYINIDLSQLVANLETETVLLPVVDAEGKRTGFKYYSEADVRAFLAADPGNTVADIDVNTPGGVLIDVIGDVVNNFEEITQTNTTINKGDGTFYTVGEYIQYISQVDGNVIYTEVLSDPSDPQSPKVPVFEYWDGTKYETINLGDLVQSLEKTTNLMRSVVIDNGVLPGFTAVGGPTQADVKEGQIYYQYINESGEEQFVNMTEDLLTSITNNEEVNNAIIDIINKVDGNVFFGDHDNEPSTDDVLYHIVAGNNIPIDINAIVLNYITNNANSIKIALGDKITNSQVTNTGDTINGQSVYKFLATTTVGGNTPGAPSAMTSGITLPADANATGIVNITLLQDQKVVANSVTNVVVAGNIVTFNLGTGTFYTALPAGDYDVIVEFTSSNQN